MHQSPSVADALAGCGLALDLGAIGELRACHDTVGGNPRIPNRKSHTQLSHNRYRLKKSKAKNTDFVCLVHPPPKFNSSPLKNDGWKTTFLLERAIFKGYVKLPGSIGFTKHASKPMEKFTMFAWHIHPSFDIFDTCYITMDFRR